MITIPFQWTWYEPLPDAYTIARVSQLDSTLEDVTYSHLDLVEQQSTEWLKPDYTGTNDYARYVGIDLSGNVYTARHYRPTTNPQYYDKINIWSCEFSKTDPLGNLVWSTHIREDLPAYSYIEQFCVSDSGDVYAIIRHEVGNRYYVIHKIDTNGNLQWSTTWYNEPIDSFYNNTQIVPANDGGVYLATILWSDFSYIRLQKYNNNGLLLWSKKVNLLWNTYFDVTTDSLGNLYLLSGPNVVKVSPTGNIVWTASCPPCPDDINQPQFTYAPAIGVDNAGNVYSVQQVITYDGGFGYKQNQLYIVKFDNNGTKIYTKSVPFNQGVQNLANNCYIKIGPAGDIIASFSEYDFNITNESNQYTTGFLQRVFVRLDPNANVVWQRVLQLDVIGSESAPIITPPSWHLIDSDFDLNSAHLVFRGAISYDFNDTIVATSYEEFPFNLKLLLDGEQTFDVTYAGPLSLHTGAGDSYYIYSNNYMAYRPESAFQSTIEYSLPEWNTACAIYDYTAPISNPLLPTVYTDISQPENAAVLIWPYDVSVGVQPDVYVYNTDFINASLQTAIVTNTNNWLLTVGDAPSNDIGLGADRVFALPNNKFTVNYTIDLPNADVVTAAGGSAIVTYDDKGNVLNKKQYQDVLQSGYVCFAYDIDALSNLICSIWYDFDNKGVVSVNPNTGEINWALVSIVEHSQTPGFDQILIIPTVSGNYTYCWIFYWDPGTTENYWMSTQYHSVFNQDNVLVSAFNFSKFALAIPDDTGNIITFSYADPYAHTNDHIIMDVVNPTGIVVNCFDITIPNAETYPYLINFFNNGGTSLGDSIVFRTEIYDNSINYYKIGHLYFRITTTGTVLWSAADIYDSSVLEMYYPIDPTIRNGRIFKIYYPSTADEYTIIEEWDANTGSVLWARKIYLSIQLYQHFYINSDFLEVLEDGTIILTGYSYFIDALNNESLFSTLHIIKLNSDGTPLDTFDNITIEDYTPYVQQKTPVDVIATPIAIDPNLVVPVSEIAFELVTNVGSLTSNFDVYKDKITYPTEQLDYVVLDDVTYAPKSQTAHYEGDAEHWIAFLCTIDYIECHANANIDLSGNVYTTYDCSYHDANDNYLGGAVTAKIGPTGTIQYQKSIPYQGASNQTADSNGNVYVTSGQFNNQTFILDYIITKYDSNGLILWQTGLIYQDSPSYAGQMVATDDGYLYTVYDYGWSIFITKYGIDGSVVWQKEISTTDIPTLFSKCINVLSDGSLVIFAYDSGNNFVVIKVSPTGTVDWARTSFFPFSGTTNSNSLCINVDSSDNIYVSSTVQYGMLGDSSITYCKYTSSGLLLYSKVVTIAPPGSLTYASANGNFTNTTVDPNGNIYSVFMMEYHPMTLTPGDIAIVKFDTDVNLLWQNVIYSRDPDHVFLNYWARPLIAASADDLVISTAGYNDHFNLGLYGNYSGDMVMLAKLPADGSGRSDYTFTDGYLPITYADYTEYYPDGAWASGVPYTVSDNSMLYQVADTTLTTTFTPTAAESVTTPIELQIFGTVWYSDNPDVYVTGSPIQFDHNLNLSVTLESVESGLSTSIISNARLTRILDSIQFKSRTESRITGNSNITLGNATLDGYINNKVAVPKFEQVDKRVGVAKRFIDVDLAFQPHPVTGDVFKKIDDNAIKQAVKSLIMTNHYERLFHPEIGSQVTGMLFEPYGYLTDAMLKEAIINTITSHEPRVMLINVTINSNPDNNAIYVTIIFKVVNTETPITLNMTLYRSR